MKSLFPIALIALAMLLPAISQGEDPKLYSTPLKDIDGQPASLKPYAGKVLLIVNVASLCGNTPQYKGLEAIWQKYKDQGLVVLGFPCNDFGEQEPGENSEIKAFCTKSYGVTFPMFDKLHVKGPEQHPSMPRCLERSPHFREKCSGTSASFSSAGMERSWRVLSRKWNRRRPK